MPRQGQPSNNLIDMRPGKSGDPFLEVARTLANNQKRLQLQQRSKTTKYRVNTGEIGKLLDQLGREQGIQFLPQGALFGQSLSQYPNPFALSPNPGAQQGHMAVPNRLDPAGYTSTTARTLQESKPAQKSLTTKKRGRLEKQPQTWRVE